MSGRRGDEEAGKRPQARPRSQNGFKGGQNMRANIWFGALRSAVSPLPLTPSPTRSLGADRKAVRNNQGPLSAATNARPSHPAPACGSGAGGEGQNGHPNASNIAFTHLFRPPLNPQGERGNRPHQEAVHLSPNMGTVRPSPARRFRGGPKRCSS
jgi:hypothetical protein